MRIGIWAPYRGKVGTEAAMINYAHALCDLGHEIVFLELCDEFSASGAVPQGFDIVSVAPRFLHFAGKSNIFAARDFMALGMFMQGRLETVLRREKIDCVISGLLSGVPLAVAGRTRIPVIVSVQGTPGFLLDEKRLTRRLENIRRRAIWRKTYPHAHRIIAMTDYTAQGIAKEFPELQSRLVTIANPLFGDDVPKPYEFGSGDKAKRNLVFVGRSAYQKDTQLVFDTCSMAREHAPDFGFHLYGGYDSHWQKKFASLPNAHYHGHVVNLWEKLPPNAVHVVASRWEDPGHAYLEALAHQVPSIVVEAESSHYYHAKKAGLAIAPRKPDALLQAALQADFPAAMRRSIANEVIAEYGHTRFRQKIKSVLP